MKNKIVFIVFILGLFACTNTQEQKDVEETSSKDSVEILAEKPPLGWNSFDSYGVYLHEEAALANIETFAEKLKPHDYEYFVIDAGWFGEFDLVEGTLYPKEKHAKKMNFNEYGLLQPSKTYFPNGLQPIIDRCHELGLKFGLHLMRGIPREAVHQNLPIKGTDYKAADIADTTSICVWNHQNYGVDMSKPGAQEFYNSLMNQMAEWGVDFIKYDDIVPYPEEVEAVAKAIAQCGRPMVLSLSPGDKVHNDAVDFYKKANMLRVTPDIWDDQHGIKLCFDAWRKWQGNEQPGFWIDMDMIPFGKLQLMAPKPDEVPEDLSKWEIQKAKKKGQYTNVELLAGKGWTRQSEFTKDEMYTFITMRAMAASPLMMGGDLPTLDDFSLSLITNNEVLKCNQNGVMGKLVYDTDSIEIWQTPEKNSDNGWIGIFNRSNNEKAINSILEKISFTNTNDFVFTDIWRDEKMQVFDAIINANGVVFIRYLKYKK